MSFSVKIVADSKNEFSNRLTTFVVTFPRIILAEFNTHRILSKNSASSRAIPFKKMMRMVLDNPFIPLVWQKDHKGMQGKEELSRFKKAICRQLWLLARYVAVIFASTLNKVGLSKQICNRLLEPFMYHTVIVTGTEWENFFALRAHDAAEIHMQKIAYMMLEEYNKSEPKLLKAGEWHISFENEMEGIDQIPFSKTELVGINTSLNLPVIALAMRKVKISTVMAARTSFTVVGVDMKPMSYSRMIEIHDEMRDAEPKHMSPFGHCGQCMDYDRHYYEPWSGNFKGFIQYRKMIENENAKDNRVIKK